MHVSCMGVIACALHRAANAEEADGHYEIVQRQLLGLYVCLDGLICDVFTSVATKVWSCVQEALQWERLDM